MFGLFSGLLVSLMWRIKRRQWIRFIRTDTTVFRAHLPNSTVEEYNVPFL